MNIDPLLGLIRRYESGNDYNIVWSGISKHDRPKKPLSTMTVREVLAWQDSIDHRYMSEAAGAYQIMEDTLRTLRISMDAVFDKKTQDSLAVQLLRRRSLDQFIAGKITAEMFGNKIAKEWASFPVMTGPKKGRSYYAGDGLNKAHVKPEQVLRAINEIKREQPKPV